VFRALDWLASISGAKIITQKPKIGKSFTPTNAYLGCIPLQALSRQPIELESCSNPLKMGESLVVCNEKKYFRFGCCCFLLMFT